MLALIKNVNSNVEGATFVIDDSFREERRLLQTKIQGTATVSIQGRNTEDVDWINIVTLTASDAGLMKPFHQMRAVTSGVSSGSVTVVLDAVGELL